MGHTHTHSSAASAAQLMNTGKGKREVWKTSTGILNVFHFILSLCVIAVGFKGVHRCPSEKLFTIYWMLQAP